ncbi:SpoIID/LytB domain-containing protein [Thermoanaerobacter mathranii]|uniref:SpoIID/LytB domain-containing protein n=1 Tax=Thermoanaerobacter mathranii TaxID=583357 RepID=UPI003D6C34CC
MRFRKFVIVGIISAMILTLLPCSTVNADISVPKIIKIGLFYGQTAKSSYQLSSPVGFNFAYENNTGNLVNIFSTSMQNVQVIKDDSFYLMMGSYDDFEMANSEYAKIVNRITNVLIGFDGKYHIYIGPYLTLADLQSAYEILSKNYTNISKVLPDKNILIRNGAKNLFLFNMNADLYVSKLNPEGIPMAIESKRYRGMFEFRRQQDSDMTAINVVPLEEYLYGVVPGEMPAWWNIEALKAQAVAARTYAAKNVGRYGKYGFDLTNDTNTQVYKGYDGEAPSTNEAVDETKGVVAVYQGKLIDALYHSHSGGYTEDNINYFSADVPYLKGVEDKYVFGYNSYHDSWMVTYTKDQIKNLLLNKGQDIGDIVDVKVTEKSWTGRAIAVTIYGTKGTFTLRKGDIRSFFGLKSTMIDIKGDGSSEFEVYAISSYSDSQKISLKEINIQNNKGITKVSKDTFYAVGANGIKELKKTDKPSEVYTIKGSGYGHGVGLSQYGARGLADQGYNYISILKYYYKGIEVYDTINNKSL